MKHIFLILILLATLQPQTWAHQNELSIQYSQKKKKKSGFDKTKLLIGPGIGFSAGQRQFSFTINPSLGYMLSKNFHVGTTLGFTYYQQAFDYYNPVANINETFKLKVPIYSVSVFARYMIANTFILNFQPEIISTKYITNSSFTYNTQGKLIDNSIRYMVPAVILGAGYGQRISEYGYSAIMVGYDVIQNPNSPYYQTLDVRFALMLDLFNMR
ncbi:MAG: hypothetical protein R2831_02875 [Chitinophagaceae bacterium]